MLIIREFWLVSVLRWFTFAQWEQFQFNMGSDKVREFRFRCFCSYIFYTRERWLKLPQKCVFHLLTMITSVCDRVFVCSSSPFGLHVNGYFTVGISNILGWSSPNVWKPYVCLILFTISIWSQYSCSMLSLVFFYPIFLCTWCEIIDLP